MLKNKGIDIKGKTVAVSGFGNVATDLYPLIGPLVMNPKVLKANNNYPFKTTANHQWYIAVNDQEEVMGFLPVENKKALLLLITTILKKTTENY